LKDVENDDSVIKNIDTKNYSDLLKQNIIADGMLPKMENCFHALKQGVGKVCIGNISMLESDSNLFTTIIL
jgi:acetylglutamate kinase